MSNEKVARSVALEQAYVHDVYEQFSDNPRSRPWPRVQEFIEGLEPGSIVCDVGCGNGKYLNVSTSVFNIGGEKCQRLSGVAREKENEVLILDNLALPFRDESMDAVLSIAVVHHFATTERRVCALRELARVLRIGGRLIISVWAMEQSHRKFESQDVLVPWHRPHNLSTPSLELTSTTTTSEEECHMPYHTYLTADCEASKTNKTRKRGKTRNRNRSINAPDPNSSPGSSSLSSPNETCYSFVRRAIQKLAGGRRAGVHRPWFLDPFTNCAKDPPPKRYDPDGCECCECENAQDLPIELRRVDDDEIPQQRRQTFPSTQIINDLYNIKSRSMSNMNSNNGSVENESVTSIIRSNSSLASVEEKVSEVIAAPKKLSKPKLVKQKKSICEDDDVSVCNKEDEDEALDKPTEIQQVLPDIRIERSRHLRASVQKQRSLNEELMSTDRLQEKEKLRRHIHKQASLNEDLIFQRQYSFDNIRDTTAKRLQLIKNKIKSTNIDRVTGSSLRNGFVRMFQNWKNSNELISPTTTTIPEHESVIIQCSPNQQQPKNKVCERRQSKEDGSDSSKDSSLQSDTSVDSEDSFASVIFVPKSNPMSPTMTLSPGPNSSVPSSPRIKQSSCPTSPRIKQMPLSVYPLTKQLSSPKPSSVAKVENLSPTDKKIKTPIPTLAQKYSVQPIPKFKKSTINNNASVKPVNNNNNNVNTKSEEDDKLNAIKEDKLQAIKNLLNSKPGFGMRISKHTFPIVRHSSVNNGKVQSIAKPLPKLLSLELFNPETDDKDSDSSAVSSPDSVDSVISISMDKKQAFTFPEIKDEEVGGSGGKTCLRVLVEEEDDSLEGDADKTKATVAENNRLEATDLTLSCLDSKNANRLEVTQQNLSLPSYEQSNLNISRATKIKRKNLSLLERSNSIDLRNFNPNNSDANHSTQSEAQEKKNPAQASSLSGRKYSGLNPSDHQHLTLLEAASDVANSLDKTVDKVIKSSPRSKRRELKTVDVRSVIDRNYDCYPEEPSSNDEKHKLLTDLNRECQKQFNEECQRHLSDFSNWNEECHRHLSDFADKLSEKLLHEIDQYQEKIRIKQEAGSSLEHIDDPYINRLSEELQDLSKLSAEIQKQNEYLAKLSANDKQFGCSKCKQLTCTCRRKRKNTLKSAKGGKEDFHEINKGLKMGEDFQEISKDPAQEINKSVDSCDSENSNSNSLNFGHSIESAEGTDKETNFGCSNESDKDTTSLNYGCSNESDKDTSSVNFGHSIESDKDTNSVSKYSDGGSTASLASCPEWKTIKTKISEHPAKVSSSSFDEKSELSIRHGKEKSNLIPSLSDTSQESLPSDNVGGEITYHRYYHVFRKGELDQLIEKYVENLHIISSYYDHASWCVVAEKVQVWTI